MRSTLSLPKLSHVWHYILLKCMAWEDNSRHKEKSLPKGQPYLSFSVMETAFSISLTLR